MVIEYIRCGRDGQKVEVTGKDRKNATVAYLSQVSDLHQRISLKQAKIEILRDSLSLQSPKLTDMPKNPSPPVSAMEEKLVKILALEQEVSEGKMKEDSLKAGMLTMIGKMENAQEQMVLIGCFVSLKSLCEMVDEMCLTESRVWKIRRRALASMEKVLDSEGELEIWIRKQKSWM